MKHNILCRKTSAHWLFSPQIFALVCLTLLLILPGCSFFKRRQIQGIQLGAKVDLKLIYDKQRVFHEKNGFYTTDLAALEIWPKMVLYKFGFVQAAAVDVGTIPDLDPSRKDLDALKKSKPNWKLEYSPVTKLNQFDFHRLISFCPDCTATKTTFKAVAAANLDEDAVLDVWTVDHTGKMQHLVDDLQ